MEQLRARREAFHGAKSLMRVRATTGGKTQSFRAQLVVHDARRMELIAYTPVGTTAAVIRADGDQVSVDNRLEGTKTEGDVSQVFGFLGTVLPPAEMSMLILGIPPRDGLSYDVDAAGLRRASLGEMTAVFDPPSFPATKVVVTRGDDRIEIEHLEVVSE
ncbi:MAG: Outer rane lipoprotein LolB [Acidobacteriota bacterium]|nr:Outer rane lipoprotein LolB [Acidobacteriota bacterium]